LYAWPLIDIRLIETQIFFSIHSIYSYIFVAFGVGWGPHIFDWPGLHFALSGPSRKYSEQNRLYFTPLTRTRSEKKQHRPHTGKITHTACRTDCLLAAQCTILMELVSIKMRLWV
jgi:hypothetical protein